MSEMIERVAKAIAETIALAHIKHNLREINQEDQLEEYLKMFPIKVTLADSDVASAAIEAMRNPTDAMLACGEQWGLPSDPMGLKRWQEMIDAALERK
jgi:hypothetical protein